ncbi:MAG: DinB family protein [Pirellulaceae bacterium]
MDRSQIESRIDTYVAGGKQLVDAYAGLTRAQLLAVPIPGTWSLQQIAIHLFDSDMVASDRMKRIAAMEHPLLIGYDESAVGRLPGTNELDAHQACSIFAQCRQMTATILRALPDESFARYGIHNEAGKVTLAEMIDSYIEHLDGHLAHAAKNASWCRNTAK